MIRNILASLLLITIVLFAFKVASADSLSVAVKNLDGSSASEVAFGSIPYDAQNELAPQYLEVSYDCNYGPNPPVWGIDIYTNNTGTSLDPTGGMINASGTDRVVMVHAVYDATQGGITDPPDPIVDPWVYIIDKNDSNWDSQLNNNYPRLVYGFQNGDDFLSRNGSACNSPVIVYLGGLFADKNPGTYITTIYLDLYHL